MKRLLGLISCGLLIVSRLFSNDFQITKLFEAINTNFDEYPCGILGNNLLFIRNDKIQFTPFATDLLDPRKVDQFTLPKEYFNLKGNFFLIFNEQEKLRIIFSGKQKKKLDNDLFLIEQNRISKKYSLKTFPFNTKSFESHPQFSKDGKFLFYTAEQKLNNGTDIFISKFENGSFSEPLSIESINSPLNEITPFVNENGDLYFARFDTTNYNIYKAERIGELRWSTPRRLPYPINTEANELAPIVVNDKIYFASDRDNQNRNFDIYMANLCLPVFLEVNFKESAKLFSKFDKILITDSLGNVVEDKYLGSEELFLLSLQPNHTYQITIKNECTNEAYFQTNIKTLCIDTFYVKYKIPLFISNDLTKEKNIRFFLTGYYRPITRKNLEQIKKLFDYNLLGNDDSTSYIEYPQNIYFDISDTIEKALNEIGNHIAYFAKIYQLGCLPKNKNLKIEITGYSDPRPLSPKARFFEESIHDTNLNFFLEKGTPLTNELLSKLRAYFTAKELIDILTKMGKSDFLQSGVHWEIVGGGVLAEDDDYLLLRKVKIKIFFDQKEF